MTNRPSDFTVQLPRELNLDDGLWGCALIQFLLPIKPLDPIFLTCNFTEPTIVGDKELQVLAFVAAKTKEFQNKDFVQIKSRQLSSLRFKFINADGSEFVMDSGVTHLVLEFRQKCQSAWNS